MSREALLEEIEAGQLKADIPHFNVGDTIKVHIRIIEGEKERVQVFTGTVIARKGSGLSETFSLYRVAYGAGMERVFPLHSPRIAKIEVVRSGKVRRAKLYYIRGAAGKAAKVKEKIGVKKAKVAAASKPAETPAPVEEAKAPAVKEEALAPKPEEIKKPAPEVEKEKKAKGEEDTPKAD
ncbi:MAG: 50S ribosomal protein L19 [Chlamydiia bacterium]|nr:50S ribosomal protein L19 [Chlamydiia bacterium]